MNLTDETLRETVSASLLRALQQAYAKSGVVGFWRKRLASRLDESQRSYVSPVAIARIYGELDERDEAVRWLEKGYQEHAFGMTALGVFPEFAHLRSDQRFIDIARRVGLPQ